MKIRENENMVLIKNLPSNMVEEDIIIFFILLDSIIYLILIKYI